MDPTPPSTAMRASSTDTADAGSARHNAQKAAVSAWWAANVGGPGPVGERPGLAERRVRILGVDHGPPTARRASPRRRRCRPRSPADPPARLLPRHRQRLRHGRRARLARRRTTPGPAPARRGHRGSWTSLSRAVPTATARRGSPRNPPASPRKSSHCGSSRSGGREIRSITSSSSARPAAWSPPRMAATPRVKSESIRCSGSSWSAAW